MPLLKGESVEPGQVPTTDAIRAELFGDAAVPGPWDEISSLLMRRLDEAVATGRPVIIDATHARWLFWLLCTQHLADSRPVEWIGWWLTTPPDKPPQLNCSGAWRGSTTTVNRERYSCLLDLERLLFLLRLLTSFNGLVASDPSTASALLEISNHPPGGDLSQCAAVYLSRWSEEHGGNPGASPLQRLNACESC